LAQSACTAIATKKWQPIAAQEKNHAAGRKAATYEIEFKGKVLQKQADALAPPYTSAI